MRGSRATAIFLNDDNAFALYLPASSSQKSITFQKNKLHLTGLHMNAMEFNSDNWMVGMACPVCRGDGCKSCDGGLVWIAAS